MRAVMLGAAVLAGVVNAAPVKHTIDLGQPGVLERIETQSPERYVTIVGILRTASEVSCDTLPQMLKTQYGAKNVLCPGALVLTSYPAKRHLRFQLEDTEYVTNVVLSGPSGTLQPAR